MGVLSTTLTKFCLFRPNNFIMLIQFKHTQTKNLDANTHASLGGPRRPTAIGFGLLVLYLIIWDAVRHPAGVPLWCIAGLRRWPNMKP